MCNLNEETINSLIVQVCRAHRTRAHSLFSAFGLHVGQEMILFALFEEDGQTLSGLAEKLSLQPPTVTRMARRMGKSGLLTRRNCADDGRVFRLHLTDKGHKVKEKLDAAWQQLEVETTQGLSKAQQADLHELLTTVRDSLQHPHLTASKP